MTHRPFRNRNISNLPTPAAVLLALALSLTTSFFLILFDNLEHVNNTTVALIFMLPVGVSASVWGLIPGTTAAIVSFLSFNFFFIPNLYTFSVKQTEDLIVLVAFLAVAIVISELTGRVRRNLASASAREHEALRLYELNTLVTNAQDENAVARILLDKIDQTFQPDRIEILIESPSRPILMVRGLLVEEIDPAKPLVVPLQTSKELIGEIRLWVSLPLLNTEERLLNIFASQAVLSIERIRFGEVARKSRLLEESDRLKTTLLSSVSHELRSPLAAIKASVSSLKTEEVEWESAARKELLTMVDEEIDHLNNLVGNLLDMSRIESGVLKPQKKPDILAEIVSAAIARMRSQIQDHKILVNISEDLPLINVDSVQIQQVFINLLANSLKYSPLASSISISAGKQNAGFILVVMENQSRPIPETELARIFDKFYRVNPTDRITGAGLGLSICKGIIEAHGGKIWAENLAAGFAIKFTLPVNAHE